MWLRKHVYWRCSILPSCCQGAQRSIDRVQTWYQQPKGPQIWYDWDVCLCGRACPKTFRDYIMNMIAFECSFAKEWHELQKNMHIFIWSPCVKRFKGIGRIGTSISLRQETEPALLMSKSELVIPSTPSFLVLNPKGIFESFLLSFRFFFALNKWEKVVKGILLLYTNSPGGHLKMCLNSRVFTTALWLLCHALWCQSPTPVLRSCLFKSCCVVS